MLEAIARMIFLFFFFFFLLPLNAFRNYPLHSDSMNGEKIGSRSMGQWIGKEEWKKCAAPSLRNNFILTVTSLPGKLPA